MKEVKVKVTIDPKTLTVRYEVEDLEGQGCTNITNLLSQGLIKQSEGYTKEYLHQQERPAWVTDL